MLNFNDVAIRRGGRLLLEGMSFVVHRGDKVGVVGANGVGKSSLLALLIGKLDPDAGDVERPADMTLAYLAQETEASDRGAIDFVMDGDAGFRRLESALSQGAAGGGAETAHLHEAFRNIDGYSARSRAGRLMHGLGFGDGDESRPVSAFSGGWRMRLNLAQTLMCRSDLLLLDEPTNHLDLDALLWLEQWLQRYAGTLLLISHDRAFLDAVATRVLSLEHGTARLFTGNYSAFERQRAEILAVQRAAFVKQQRRIDHMREFVGRFRYKATRARQAQSRLKAMERMALIAPAHVDSPFQFEFREPESLPRPLQSFEGASVGYSETPILSGISLSISPGDRIGLLGRNGAGKSTLIRLLAGELQPLSGKQRQAANLSCGYFTQHQFEQLDAEASPMLHLQRIDPDGHAQAFRDFLGGFGFQGDKALDPVAGLSGGEKARLVLALLIYRRPNLLLLDEPANHLDLDMRHALAMALQTFDGAVVLVSHDRHLMNAVTDELWLVDRGSVMPYAGDIDAYVQLLRDRRRQEANNASGRAAGGESADAGRMRRRRDARLRQAMKPLKTDLRNLEVEIESLTRERDGLLIQLADPALYDAGADAVKRERILVRQGEVERALEVAESRWIEVMERLEGARYGPPL